MTPTNEDRMHSAALIDSVLAASVNGDKIAGLVAAAADAGGVVYESAPLAAGMFHFRSA
jgi:hypothetical protein